MATNSLQEYFGRPQEKDRILTAFGSGSSFGWVARCDVDLKHGMLKLRTPTNSEAKDEVAPSCNLKAVVTPRSACATLWSRTMRYPWLKRSTWQWPEVTAGVFGVATLISLLLLGQEIYVNASRERPASKQPQGFYVGQYNDDAPWGSRLISYGLYVPPHFKGQPGPFPMIVFLHGSGERTMEQAFSNGLPQTISARFGENGKNGKFEFVALFPIDPTGEWRPGSLESEDAMKVTDYVIAQHRIDTKRVYLTGLSSGGDGTWRLAEANPQRWAALAPICSTEQPNVSKVKHIPAWIHHGAKDHLARVELARSLSNELRRENPDTRYTEYPYGGHAIWNQVYNSSELYIWLASKKK